RSHRRTIRPLSPPDVSPAVWATTALRFHARTGNLHSSLRGDVQCHDCICHELHVRKPTTIFRDVPPDGAQLDATRPANRPGDVPAFLQRARAAELHNKHERN